MFELSGIRCGVCGMALENDLYTKDQAGEGIYWANPQLSPHTDVRVDFCGVQHSFEWHQEKVKASLDVTQETGQTAD